MKKLLVVCIFSLFSIHLFAQNWHMIPLDSLRVYMNSTEDRNFLRGVDARSYGTVNKGIEIDLSSFSRVESPIATSRPNIYKTLKINGNSNFGRKLYQEGGLTQMIFNAGGGNEITTDTLEFYLQASVGYTWAVLKNNNIEIQGRIKSVSRGQGQDSIKEVEFTVSKHNVQFKSYVLRLSKERGWLTAISFYDLISPTVNLDEVNRFTLDSYKEISQSDFYKPKHGTLVQFTFEKRDPDVYLERTVEGVYYDTTKNTSGYRAVKYGYYGKPIYKDRPVSVFQPNLGEQVANPIPGKIGKFYFAYQTTFICDKQVIQMDSSGWLPVFEADGNQFYITDLTERRKKVHIYLQGFGLISSRTYYAGISASLKWTYLFVPNNCELGSSQWRLSSVDDKMKDVIKLYPNPAQNALHINPGVQVETAEIVYMDGRTMPVDIVQNQVDVSEFPSGMYLVRLLTDNNYSTHKIQILHE